MRFIMNDQCWNKPIKQEKRIIPTGPKHSLVPKSTSQLLCHITVGFPVQCFDSNNDYEINKIITLGGYIISAIKSI
jgi:hypothetical protein